jgi:hypothetical protein
VTIILSRTLTLAAAADGDDNYNNHVDKIFDGKPRKEYSWKPKPRR